LLVSSSSVEPGFGNELKKAKPGSVLDNSLSTSRPFLRMVVFSQHNIG
jgi:hypothetical protein